MASCLSSESARVEIPKMPREIYSEDEFRKILEKTSECRVVRRKDKTKIKLVTPKMLYTFVTKSDQANALLKNVKVGIIEL